jgi:hypothetical protein
MPLVITPRRQEILDWFVANSVVTRLCPPAFAARVRMNVAKTTFERHLRRLLQLGYLAQRDDSRLHIPEGAASLPPLSDRQRELYEYLCEQSVVLRLCPRIVEGERHFGIHRQAFERHVRLLIRSGHLALTPCQRLYVPEGRL